LKRKRPTVIQQTARVASKIATPGNQAQRKNREEARKREKEAARKREKRGR
jgi:hypothetical protein